MIVEAEVVCQQSISLSNIQYPCNLQEFGDIVAITSPISSCVSDSPFTSESNESDSVLSHAETNSEEGINLIVDGSIEQFVPCIRSGCFADIGRRRYMEDEHIMIDDLTLHLDAPFVAPRPCAFYGVFDGHGGSEAATYVCKNALKLFFEDVKFPQTTEVDDGFLIGVESSIRKSFLLADMAIGDDCSIVRSSGTTALTVMIFGRLMVVANAGDCRAVLSRKGEAVDMSEDHRPVYPSERRRVEEMGGYVDDGYLNGVLSVSRALGDWDMKCSTSSPLIADPELRETFLTEDDEFLVIGCDGVWDVISSQDAVSLVRRGLRRHDDPEQCARDLAMEALRLNTIDNLTVIVVSFSPIDPLRPPPVGRRCCGLSPQALCSLRSLLDADGGGDGGCV